MRRFKYIVISGLLISFFGFKTHAEPIWQIDQPKFQLDLQSIFQTKCKALENKINGRINHYNGKKDTHHATYTKLSDRLSQKIDNWEDLGYEVEDLKDNLEELDNKISKYLTDYNAYIEKLEEAKDGACDLSTDDFKDLIAENKEAIKQVKQDSRDIRQYYQNTIRPNILALKDQVITEEE